mgnify:CR=1 FL=1
MPSSKQEVDMMQKFGPKTRPGIFAGYHSFNGGKWSGDYLVVDAEALASCPSTQSTCASHQRDCARGKVSFPVRDVCFQSAPNLHNLAFKFTHGGED